jgi:hypothetical protein
VPLRASLLAVVNHWTENEVRERSVIRYYDYATPEIEALEECQFFHNATCELA